MLVLKNDWKERFWMLVVEHNGITTYFVGSLVRRPDHIKRGMVFSFDYGSQKLVVVLRNGWRAVLQFAKKKKNEEKYYFMIVHSYYKRIFKRNHSYENVFPEEVSFSSLQNKLRKKQYRVTWNCTFLTKFFKLDTRTRALILPHNCYQVGKKVSQIIFNSC